MDELYALEEVPDGSDRGWEVIKRTNRTMHLRRMALGASIRSAGNLSVYETEPDESGDQIVIRQLKDGTYRVNKGRPLRFSNTAPSVTKKEY